MARDTNFNNPTRQVIQTNEDQRKYDLPTFRRMEVNAQVRNQYVEPTSNNALVLATSLAAASPGVTLWLAAKSRDRQDEDVQKGMQARNEAGDVTDEQASEFSKVSSSAYQKGYMRLHGYLAGKEDATKIQNDWQSDPERNNMSTDAWIKNWYSKNTKGLEDGDFLSTYNKEVLTEADKLRQIGRDEKVASVVQATDGAVTQYIKEKILSGEFNRDVFEGAATDAGGIWGISKGKFDDLALAATNQIIEEGKNPAAAKTALAVFKENKSDGTPGLAYKGKMLAEGTIDQLTRKADQVAIQSLEYEDKAARLGREKQRESTMKDIWTAILVENNPDKGRQMAIGAIKAHPELFDSKDILQTMSQINSQSGKVETNGMKVKSAQMMADALEGKITVQDVADGVRDGKISFGSAGSLMSAVKSARAEDAAIFKTPDFQRSMGFINALPNADMAGMNRDVYQLRKEQAKLSLMNYAKDGGKDVVKYAQELHKNEIALINSGALDEELKYFSPIYTTPQMLKEARDRGDKIPDDVVARHIKYFKATTPPPKKQNKSDN